jgi:hypothetical protein
VHGAGEDDAAIAFEQGRQQWGRDAGRLVDQEQIGFGLVFEEFGRRVEDERLESCRGVIGLIGVPFGLDQYSLGMTVERLDRLAPGRRHHQTPSTLDQETTGGQSERGALAASAMRGQDQRASCATMRGLEDGRNGLGLIGCGGTSQVIGFRALGPAMNLCAWR